MKSIKILCLSLFLGLFSNTTKAQSSLGGRLGFDEFSGFVALSYKSEFKQSAIELNGAINLDVDWVGFMVDYYFFERDLDFDTPGTWQWYTGAGGQLWLGNSFVVGPDAKIGMEYKFEDTPVEAFVDLAMFLGIGPDDSNLGLQLGLGVRVPFK